MKRCWKILLGGVVLVALAAGMLNYSSKEQMRYKAAEAYSDTLADRLGKILTEVEPKPSEITICSLRSTSGDPQNYCFERKNVYSVAKKYCGDYDFPSLCAAVAVKKEVFEIEAYRMAILDQLAAPCKQLLVGNVFFGKPVCPYKSLSVKIEASDNKYVYARLHVNY